MRRRILSMRHRALWISSQNLLHIITVLLVLAIFLSEALRRTSVRKQSIASALDKKPVQPTQTNSIPNQKGDHRNMAVSSGVMVQGNSLNLELFRKEMEQKALLDALKRRAVIEKQKIARKNGLFRHRIPKVDDRHLHEQDDASRTENELSGEFRGVLKTPDNAHLFNDDNITHLSFMVYRLVKTHKISSLVDIPCKWSMFWMPELVQRLEFEIPGFRYSCIVAENKDRIEALYRFRDLDSIEIIYDSSYWATQMPSMDLALTWHSLGFLSPKNSWQLLKALRKSGTKYVIVPNYPGLLHNPGVATKHGRINVRRAPYRFDEALRVIQNVSIHQAVRKQILFYDLEGIRLGVL